MLVPSVSISAPKQALFSRPEKAVLLSCAIAILACLGYQIYHHDLGLSALHNFASSSSAKLVCVIACSISLPVFIGSLVVICRYLKLKRKIEKGEIPALSGASQNVIETLRGRPRIHPEADAAKNAKIKHNLKIALFALLILSTLAFAGYTLYDCPESHQFFSNTIPDAWDHTLGWCFSELTSFANESKAKLAFTIICGTSLGIITISVISIYKSLKGHCQKCQLPCEPGEDNPSGGPPSLIVDVDPEDDDRSGGAPSFIVTGASRAVPTFGALPLSSSMSLDGYEDRSSRKEFYESKVKDKSDQ